MEGGTPCRRILYYDVIFFSLVVCAMVRSGSLIYRKCLLKCMNSLEPKFCILRLSSLMFGNFTMHCDSCKKCMFLGFFWLFSLQFFSMGYDGCILYAFL